MSQDNTITYHYRIHSPIQDRFYGEIYVKYVEHLGNGFYADREKVLSTLHPFASETTARKYTKKELDKVIRENPKKELKKRLNVWEG